jgi:hypothetical protein
MRARVGLGGQGGDGIIPGCNLCRKKRLCSGQSRPGRTLHFVNQGDPSARVDPDLLEIARFGDMSICQTRTGVAGVVSSELRSGLDNQVIEIGRDAECPANTVAGGSG